MLKRLRVNIHTGDVQGIHEAVRKLSFRTLAQTEKFDKTRHITELVKRKLGNVERLKEVYLCLLKRLSVNIYTGDVQGIQETVYQVSEH